MPTERIQRPPTATHPWVGTMGFVVMAAVLPFLFLNYTMHPALKTVIITLAVALTMCAVEIFVFKAHRRPSTGIDWSANNYDLKRIAIKLLGMLGIFATAGAVYFVLPLYHNGMYAPFINSLYYMLPYLFVGFVVYIAVLDGKLKKPEDGYYALGNLILLRKDKVNFDLLAPLGRSWLIKAFFIPAMFSFLTNNMSNLSYKFTTDDWYINSHVLFGSAITLLYSIDLIFALIGYIFAFRVIDTHERSSDPTMTGWVAALFCYPPFWQFMEQNFIVYRGPVEWHQIFAEHQFILVFWAAAILLVVAFYTWATVVFGCRFSNLTHRGIITNGPYRFTKHPAYIAKNISWWLIAVPFLAFDNPMDALRHSTMLFLLNAIYFLRAWTEERHLANDPIYRDYQAYIAKHGIFRWINILPADKIGRVKLNPSVVIE